MSMIGCVFGFWDKGCDVFIEVESLFVDDVSGEMFVCMVVNIFVCGEGGFGGDLGFKLSWVCLEWILDVCYCVVICVD